MIIKKLEIQGFKSFSDRTRMIFHPGITAVIGPNGTGKSNIVDALLWVLRGRRLKALRGDRSGDIIFNGNAKVAPLSMGDVSLVLGDELDKDKEELVINHRVFRSGENEYRLNGKQVRLKDIQDTLWKNAIGETEYFVIEQGNVGLFVTSKPQEKRLLLEEAAGTSFYKDKKRQAQNKLENSEQNMIRLEDIIIEVEKAKNSLNRQAHAAIRYRKLREQIRELTLAQYREKIAALENSQQEISGHYRQSLEQENNFISHIKIEEKNLAAERKEVWDFEKQLKQKQEQLYSLKAQASRLEAEKDREEKRIDFFNEKMAAAKRNQVELKQELTTIDTDLQQTLEDLSKSNQLLQKKKDEFSVTDQSSRQSQKELESRQLKLQSSREEYVQNISNQTGIKNEAAKIEKEIELIQRQLEKLTSDDSSQQAELKTITGRISTNQEVLKQDNSQLSAHQKGLSTLSQELYSTRERIELQKQELSKLQSEKDKNSHHLHALEKMKAQGVDSATTELPTALGFLADKLETSAEHELMVDIFYKEEAGATLLHSQDFLKLQDNPKMQGKYLLLHPNKNRIQASAAYKDSRVIGLLKSFVKADDKIKNFLTPLPDAAIVKDIKHAVELWLLYPELNYITARGDVLLSSGLMHLGQKKEGLFSLTREIKSIQAQIDSLEGKISPLARQLSKNNEKKLSLETELEERATTITDLERKIEILNRENSYDISGRDRIKGQIGVWEQEAKRLEKNKKNQSDQLYKLTLKIGEFEQNITTLKQASKKEAATLAQLQAENEQSRKHFFELRADIDVIQEKITGLNQARENLVKRKENISDKISASQTEHKSSEQENQALNNSIASFSSNIEKLGQEIQAKEAALLKDEAELSGRQQIQQEREERINKLRDESEGGKDERVKWEVKKAEKERDLVNLEESCWQDLKKTLEEVKKEVELDPDRASSAEAELEVARDKLQRFKAVNLMAEEEYLIQKERFDFLTKEKEDLLESINTTKEAIKKIDQESKTQFLRALIAVNKNFQDVFSILFNGGIAQVKLTDENNPLESGVEIVAQPPGKKVQSLTLLSGGEKTLTSLAFFFALFRYKPAPFCILDEVDAALDEENLVRFLNLMKKIKDQTQFIIVTHNFKTMEVADYIYGTTMAEPNITSIYSVKIQGKKITRSEEADPLLFKNP